jgi:hypothetical protein
MLTSDRTTPRIRDPRAAQWQTPQGTAPPSG